MVPEFIYISLILHMLQNEVICAECTFYSGSVSYVRTCSTGCCESACCTDNYKMLAVILGTVFGCVLFLTGMIILVMCCTKDRWLKKVSPRKGTRNEDESNPVLTDVGKLNE